MADKLQEIISLADYMDGFGDAFELFRKTNGEFKAAAEWLRKLSYNVCGAGFIGCSGGRDCTSSHK